MRIEDIFAILKAIRAKSPDYNLDDIETIFTSCQCKTPSPKVLRELTDALKDIDEPKLDSAALWAEIMKDSFEEEAIARYGFHSEEELNAYRRLKPFFILSAHFENNAQSLMLAYKLIVAFGNDVKALAYIQQFEKIQPKNMVPVHDATLFTLPVGAWDLKMWREMNEKYLLNDEYVKAFSLANKVEDFHKGLQGDNDSLELQKLVEEEVQRTTNNTIQKTKDKTSSEFNNLKQSLTNPGSNTLYTEREYIEVHRAIQENSLTKKQQRLKELREKPGKNDVKVTQLEKDIASISFDEVKVAKTYQDGVKKITSGLAVYLQIAVNNKTHEIARHKAQVRESIRRSYMAPLEKLGPDMLFKIALLSGYNRASENRLAAQMLLSLGVPEYLFDKYLDLVKINPPQNSDALLPKVYIDGEAYYLPGYFMCKLDDDDPRGAFLGYPTGCCQHLGSLGATSAIYGVTQSNSGFYIVVKGKLPSDLKSSKSIPTRNIVAQTWAWRNKNANIMVFDSLERNKSKISSEVMLSLFMGIAIHIQKRDPSIEQIYVGKTYELMNYKAAPASLELKYPQTEMSYRGYTDARRQFIFLDRDNPWPYFAYYAPLFCFNLVKLGLPLSPEEVHELAASFLTNMLWQDESKFNQDIFSWALTHCSPTYFHEEIMGNTPLFFAAKRKNTKAFNILWERYTPAEILGKNKSGQTLLHVVEHLTMLENILSKLTASDVRVMLNDSNNLHQTALYCAASNPEIFLKLLSCYSTEEELWTAINRTNYDSFSAMRRFSMSTVVDKLIEASKTKSPEVIVTLFNRLSKERKLKLLETKRIMDQLAGSVALLPILQSLQDESVAKGLGDVPEVFLNKI